MNALSSYEVDMSKRVARVTPAGQISLPAPVRRRWDTKTVSVEDHGDYVVVRPLPADPIAAARGSLRGPVDVAKLRERAREDEAAADARR
jgi:bifunctional DNA-binding transcriptional regulator/antitoxin component of YhaV-PrlF toxin-antitoxin module